MNTLIDPALPGLAAYYRFDEIDGTTVLDQTSNDNNGVRGGGNAADEPMYVSSPVPSNTTFTINLMQLGNPTTILQIATDVPNNGTYAWTVPSSLPPGSDYVIQITRDDGSGVVGVSQPFTIAPPTTVYYVNGPTVTPGGYTTAPGNDANDGLTPATPMASIGDVLHSYDLSPGDIIMVDAGTYVLGSNLILTAADSGITIEGYSNPRDPNLRTVLDRANTNSGSYVVQMAGATGVTLENLGLTGGSYGLYAPADAGSTGLTVSGSILFANATAGAFVGSSNDDASFTNDTVYGIPDQPGAVQGTGIAIDSADALVIGNIVYDTSGVGLSLSGASADVSGNTAYGDADGISVSGSGSTVSGNTVFDNTSAGIAASGSVTVSDNTVYGQTGGATGISLTQGAVATGNVVYGNATGIAASYGGSVTDNRVYDNSGAGIVAVLGTIAVQGNDVYGNGTGIDLGEYYTGTVSNNVLEGNATAGIHDQASPYGGPQYLDNNTIVAELGNAVQVDGGTVGAELLNNILWAQAGYDIAVAANSEVGFQSDYNDLYTTGAGNLGSWEGHTISSLVDWFYELGLDGHSITTNPEFVNPAGPDGVTGFSTAPIGSPVVINDSSVSGFSDTGSWTQATTGGYLTAAPGDNTAIATWTFTGLTPGATYELAASWPAGGYLVAADAPFTVLDGSTIVGFRRVAQYVGSSGISDNGSAFQSLGDFVTSTGTLTVMLTNNANSTVEADAVLLQEIVGDHGADDDYQLLTSSPAVAAGDPNSYSFQEPAPDGDRIDLGAFGDTPDATPSPAQVVQVALAQRPGEVPGRPAGHHRLADRRVDRDGARGPGQRRRRRHRQLRPRPVPDLRRLVRPLLHPGGGHQWGDRPGAAGALPELRAGLLRHRQRPVVPPGGPRRHLHHPPRLRRAEPVGDGRRPGLRHRPARPDGAGRLRHRGRGRDGVQGDGPDLHGDGQRRPGDQPQPGQRHGDPGGALGHRGVRGQRGRCGQSDRGPPGLARWRDDVDDDRQRLDDGRIRAGELRVDHPDNRGAGERLPDPRGGRRG